MPDAPLSPPPGTAYVLAPPIPLALRPTTVNAGEQDSGLGPFNFLAVLSRGNSSKLFLAEQSGSLCAIKVIKKLSIIDSDELQRSAQFSLGSAVVSAFVDLC